MDGHQGWGSSFGGDRSFMYPNSAQTRLTHVGPPYRHAFQILACRGSPCPRRRRPGGGNRLTYARRSVWWCWSQAVCCVGDGRSRIRNLRAASYSQTAAAVAWTSARMSVIALGPAHQGRPLVWALRTFLFALPSIKRTRGHATLGSTQFGFT